jgi:hypothetical protein
LAVVETPQPSPLNEISEPTLPVSARIIGGNEPAGNAERIKVSSSFCKGAPLSFRVHHN